MKLFGQSSRSIVQHQAEWWLWQQQSFGKSLLQHEKAVLAPLVKQKSGTHLLQVSIAGCEPLFDSSPIINKTFVQISDNASRIQFEANCSLLAEPCDLPLANESFDAVILHHILEYSGNPHQVLRESHRILTSGGQLFVVGFNPWSLMGVRKLLPPYNRAPWAGSFHSLSKLCDWLKLLGFNIELTQYAFFRAPLNSTQGDGSHSRIEKLGRKYNCFFGSTYAIVARKQMVGMTPLYETKFTRRVLTFPIAEPAARSVKTFDNSRC